MVCPLSPAPETTVGLRPTGTQIPPWRFKHDLFFKESSAVRCPRPKENLID